MILRMSHDIIEAFCALEDICKAQKRANIPLVIPFDPTIRGMEALQGIYQCVAGLCGYGQFQIKIGGMLGKKKRPQKGRRSGDAIAGGLSFVKYLH